MFGKYLVEQEKISLDNLNTALQVHQFYKKKIGRVCRELGYIKAADLDKCLYDYLKVDKIYTFDCLLKKAQALQLLNEEKELCLKKRVIPIHSDMNFITLAMNSFCDADIEEFENLFQREVKCHFTTQEMIDLIYQQLGEKISLQKVKQIIMDQKLGDDQKLELNDPYIKILKHCFLDAKKSKASDVHFEPFQNEFLIRMRIYGVLVDWKVLTPNHGRPLITALKYLINMDMAIMGQPQDSRASFQDFKIEIRASSMPVTSGEEKIVLRLQYQDQSIQLNQLGLSDENINVLLNGIRKKDGLILISGPTGSGKTTTLYALLEEMDRMGKNISTLENPVEKRLPRINQAKLQDYQDFESFQRALMRQDPDVILLGEIRDTQTADLSLKLASTGHLVLSTIHANGALEVIDRLTNLGADLFSIKANLRLSIAQRLVRQLCPQCAIPTKNPHRTSNPQGCAQCHKGVIGRVAIIEYLSGQELKVKRSLQDEIIHLANLGIIDCKELEAA